MTVLLANQTSDGRGSEAHVLQDYHSTLFVWGTFGGATVTIEVSPDGIEWFTLPSLTITAKYVGNVDLAARGGIYIRAFASGTTTSSLNAELR